MDRETKPSSPVQPEDKAETHIIIVSKVSATTIEKYGSEMAQHKLPRDMTKYVSHISAAIAVYRYFPNYTLGKDMILCVDY